MKYQNESSAELDETRLSTAFLILDVAMAIMHRENEDILPLTTRVKSTKKNARNSSALNGSIFQSAYRLLR